MCSDILCLKAVMHNRSSEWCIYDCLHSRIIISVWRKKKVTRVRSACLFCLCCCFVKFSWRLQGYWVHVLLCTGCLSNLRFEVQAVRALHNNQVLLELQNIKIDAKNKVNLYFKNSVCSKVKQQWNKEEMYVLSFFSKYDN